ncbi:MAG TPA: DEAD/DEAH box helicase family protein [Solirubrobacteraceae bacterium]|nr:DEAD/DEAH box helicase family protein [Solirubrobacteraceae bacterium]
MLCERTGPASSIRPLGVPHCRPFVPPSGPTLRPWQRHALDHMAGWQQGSFLISAAPGAGKTHPALVFAAAELRAGRARRVAVICPTTPLTRQWAQAAARLGLHLLPDAPGLRPPGDFQGVSLTYARVAMSPADYARSCGPGTLVIADEAHHLGDDLAWGEGFRVAFGQARRWLLLSGTPFRSDQAAIPGVRYDDGVAVPDVSYTYADAVRDGVCRRVAFVPYDGTLQWRSGDDVIETSFGEVLTAREAGRRYRTAISTELPDGLPRILRAAHAKLLEIRGGGHRDAGGLVVTADSSHARAVAKALGEITGAAPIVVLHTEANAHRKLEAFRRGRDPWIVAVNMVSEGVDIPRLRVGVYSTVAKTPLIFRQIVGRFVRVIPGRPVELSHVFLPADGGLRALAADVETELRHMLKPPDEAADGLLDDEALERARRTETEPSEAPFVPLAADVVPQLALFAEPGVPPRAPTPIIASGPAGDPEPAPSAFERRADLRAERHRLVSELRRLDGRSHREINAWLNKATGVRRVEDATIDQLHRSIDLLVETLRKRSSRRRTPARA